MAGGCSPIKTILCDVQEVIDKFNNQYDNISNDKDKFAYIMNLKETIVPSTRKAKIYSLDSGIYRVRARRTMKNELSPDVVRYYIDIYERPEGQDIGVTNEQIEELKKFVDFLERDDVKKEIYEHEKAMRKGGLVILPIAGVIFYFATRASIFWSTLICGGLIVIYILMIIEMVKNKEFSRKK